MNRQSLISEVRVQGTILKQPIEKFVRSALAMADALARRAAKGEETRGDLVDLAKRLYRSEQNAKQKREYAEVLKLLGVDVDEEENGDEPEGLTHLRERARGTRAPSAITRDREGVRFPTQMPKAEAERMLKRNGARA